MPGWMPRPSPKPAASCSRNDHGPGPSCATPSRPRSRRPTRRPWPRRSPSSCPSSRSRRVPCGVSPGRRAGRRSSPGLASRCQRTNPRTRLSSATSRHSVLRRRPTCGPGPASPAPPRSSSDFDRRWCRSATRAGREMLDLPDAPRPDAETPAPVRFLPVYDNATLSHADRGRIIDERHRRAVLTLDMINFGSILVDGFARAIWRVARDGRVGDHGHCLPGGSRPRRNRRCRRRR